jgi:hypothetical protein
MEYVLYMSFRQFLESNWSSFRPGRQKEFPFSHEPGYSRKATNFLDPDYLDPDQEQETNFNLYHVTTNLAGVKMAGRLKSRRELGIVGLGGGAQNEAPGMVSTTYDYNRAREIYEQIKFVAEMVRGQGSAASAFDAATVGLHDAYEDREIINVLEDFLPAKVLKKLLDGEIDETETLNRYINKPRDVYKFFQDLESAVSGIEAQGEYTYHMSTIGFTGSFEDMLKINPSQVAIIQVAARKDASSPHIPFEKELRFSPQDLRIVRYFQP